jgi:hypothetical protein
MENNSEFLTPNSALVYEAIRAALADARTKVVAAVNTAMVGVYWEIGRQIASAIGDRAEYGKGLIAYLSQRLTEEFGKGFSVANLRNMRQFYQAFPIRYTLRSELSWSHYRLLMRGRAKTPTLSADRGGTALGVAA